MIERFTFIKERLSGKELFVTNIINKGTEDEHYQVKWFNPISGLYEIDTVRPGQIIDETNTIGFNQ